MKSRLRAAIGSGIDISRGVRQYGGGHRRRHNGYCGDFLGGTVVSYSLKIAGDNFDDAIIRYNQKEAQCADWRKNGGGSENLKLGTAFERTIPVSMDGARQEPDYGTAEEFLP